MNLKYYELSNAVFAEKCSGIEYRIKNKRRQIKWIFLVRKKIVPLYCVHTLKYKSLPWRSYFNSHYKQSLFIIAHKIIRMASCRSCNGACISPRYTCSSELLWPRRWRPLFNILERPFRKSFAYVVIVLLRKRKIK